MKKINYLFTRFAKYMCLLNKNADGIKRQLSLKDFAPVPPKRHSCTKPYLGNTSEVKQRNTRNFVSRNTCHDLT